MHRLALLTAVLLMASPVGAKDEEVRPQLTVQMGSGSVLSLAFSPDGDHLLTGSRDGTARLWEVATGRLVRSFEGHRQAVSSVAFSPDGDEVLTGSWDKTVRLLKTASGRLVRRFKFQGVVSSVAFSHDGTQILAGALDGKAQVRDIAAGNLVRQFVSPREVYSVAFSPNGEEVLTGSYDKTARLWSVATGREIRSFEGHDWAVSSVAFSPDGTHVLTGSTVARLWDTATGNVVRTFKGQRARVTCAAFSPDGRHIVTGSAAQEAHIWSVSTGREIHRLEGHGFGILSAAFSPDGTLVATGSDDRTMRFWQAATGREVRRIDGHGQVLSIALSPDGTRALIGSTDQTARLWNTRTGQEIRSFREHTGKVTSVAYARDGAHVLTGSWDKTARLWDTATGESRQTFEGHNDVITSVALSPDGKYVLTGSYDKTARLWRAATGEVVQRFEGHEDVVTAVAFSPDGRRLLTGSADATVRLWKTSGGQLWTFKHDGHVTSAAFSADGTHVLTGCWSNTARLLETSSKREVQRFEGDGYVSCVAFSPDGKHVLTGSNNRTARMFEIATGRAVRRFDGHGGAVLSVALSPEGNHVFTGSGDGTVRLWRAADGREICARVSFGEGAWAVVTPDGRFDTGEIESLEGLHWVVPDDPLRALPIEMFMRDYFEPSLLSRAIAGDAFPSLPRLDRLNRALPRVRVKDVTTQPDAPNRVRVAVEIEATSRAFTRAGKAQVEHSGAFDLKLFRDGHIVRWTDGPLTLENGRASVVFEGVFVDAASGLDENVFSAYAFNTDGVKSETHTHVHPLGEKRIMQPPTAYVIAMGVDAFDQAGWNLTYAAADARAIVDRLSRSLQAGQDHKLVPVLLISEKVTKDGKTVPTNGAHKQDLQTVLAALAGLDADLSHLAHIPNADKLRKARPQDVVVISISTHGVTGANGEFYLLPSNVAARGDEQKWLSSLISADELSRWLRGVDAGEMALIVDACQSAASVKRDGFKPGPMGSRGLGQLAYDKRMRILAASQAAGVALESRLVKHGLLTYALLVDGLEKGRADFDPKDGKTTLDEWLRYGLSRVPGLAVEVVEGKVRSAGLRGLVLEADADAPQPRLQQQPSLFDFSKGKASRVTLKH